MSFKIFTDTSSNLPKRFLDKSDIGLIPFSYYNKAHPDKLCQCMDIEAFDGKGFYASMGEGSMYNTSQITPQTYLDCISPFAKEGNDILFISMSSGISGSYNSSLIAKSILEEEFPDVKFCMLDTRAASLGEGLVALKAAEYRDAGMSLEECCDALTDMCDRMYQIFTVDSLRHLQRTGRLSNAAMIIGAMLNIKPILKGNEKGQIINIDKVRGTKKAMKSLADKYNEIVVDAGSQTIGVAHADNDEDADYLIELLKAQNPPKDILKVCYEPVTGAHVGPGTVALFFLGDKNARSK